MTDELRLGPGMIGSIHYTARLTESGELIETTGGDTPLAYLHGSGVLVPGLEEALAGCSAGQRVDLDLPPEKAFGVPSGREPARVRRTELPRGTDWAPGMSIVVRAEDGTLAELWVTRAKGAWVWVSADHPLAGKMVSFEVVVAAVRVASPEEQAHGHPRETPCAGH